MSSEQQAQTEARIRAAIDRLLTGDLPEGLKCDVKSLCVLAQVPRATLYRTYPHLKAEFEDRLGNARNAGHQPDPRLAQIENLKAEVSVLRERLRAARTQTTALEEFKSLALSQLAAQHDEIAALRRELPATRPATVRSIAPPTRTVQRRQ